MSGLRQARDYGRRLRYCRLKQPLDELEAPANQAAQTKRCYPSNGARNKAKQPIAPLRTEKTQSQRCTWSGNAPEWRGDRKTPSILHHFGANQLMMIKKINKFNGLRVNLNGMHFAAVSFGAWSYAALIQKLATRS